MMTRIHGQADGRIYLFSFKALGIGGVGYREYTYRKFDSHKYIIFANYFVDSIRSSSSYYHHTYLQSMLSKPKPPPNHDKDVVKRD